MQIFLQRKEVSEFSDDTCDTDSKQKQGMCIFGIQTEKGNGDTICKIKREITQSKVKKYINDVNRYNLSN